MFGVLIMIHQLDDSNKLRSSIGIGIDWFTPIGPMNFSFCTTN